LIRETDGSADCIAADVSLPGQVEAMVAKTIAAFGRLDCAFNNAGIAGALGGLDTPAIRKKPLTRSSRSI
jgi:NAD(P)-dependent dehydrogenase (short-subunit alcohol dehydrogenase family)